MAKDVTLTDINGEKIYPKTYMKNVYDSSGQKTLEDKMVTTDTIQTITSDKYFTSAIYFDNINTASTATYRSNIYQYNDGLDISRRNATDGSDFASVAHFDLANRTLTVGGNKMATVTDVNNLSMCPASGKYVQTSIKSYTTVNDVVFTAPDNGFAVIRGNFSGSWAYYIKDGSNSFYQWASASGSPFFPLRKGAQILINYVTGTMTWADLYFVSAKQI